jgi:hypothetical protein
LSALMLGSVPVREPKKGCPMRASGLPGAADGAKRRPRETPGRRWAFAERRMSAKRAGGVRAKARTRFPPVDPRRAKPKGASGGKRTKPATSARDSRKGHSPETAACWAGPPPSATGAPTGETVCGPLRPETRRTPFERRKLRRANPKSAAGAKKNRHGLGRSKPPRG